MLFVTQYTLIPTCAAKFKNFAEMKHPCTVLTLFSPDEILKSHSNILKHFYFITLMIATQSRNIVRDNNDFNKMRQHIQQPDQQIQESIIKQYIELLKTPTNFPASAFSSTYLSAPAQGYTFLPGHPRTVVESKRQSQRSRLQRYTPLHYLSGLIGILSISTKPQKSWWTLKLT